MFNYFCSFVLSALRSSCVQSNRQLNFVIRIKCVYTELVVSIQRNLSGYKNRCDSRKLKERILLHLLRSLGGTFNCTFLYITYLMNIYRGRRHHSETKAKRLQSCAKNERAQFLVQLHR